jgi:hypothetical protein
MSLQELVHSTEQDISAIRAQVETLLSKVASASDNASQRHAAFDGADFEDKLVRDADREAARHVSEVQALRACVNDIAVTVRSSMRNIDERFGSDKTARHNDGTVAGSCD